MTAFSAAACFSEAAFSAAACFSEAAFSAAAAAFTDAAAKQA